MLQYNHDADILAVLDRLANKFEVKVYTKELRKDIAFIVVDTSAMQGMKS